jgi:hypothetical protein
LLGAARGDPATLSPGPPYISTAGTAEDYAAWGDSRYVYLSQSPPLMLLLM